MTKFRTSRVVSIFFILFAFSIAGAAHAATSPSLGTADTFGVLSTTFTANSGLTAVTGDVGYTTLSGSGTISVSGATVTPAPAQAVLDQNSALSALNLQSCDFTFTGVLHLGTDTTHGPVGIYTPGVYCSTGAMDIDAGSTITLNGAGTYIFRSGGAFDTTANSIVALSGGATACDVFWTGISAATLGANSTFKGTIIDDAGITVGSTVGWVGRALAAAATVTTDTDTISVPTGCSVVVPPPSPSPSSPTGGGSTPRFVPLINLVKVPDPLALPNGAGSVTYNYSVTNPSIQALSNITLKDDLCSPIEFLSGDLNGDKRLDTDETWNYRCTTTLTTTTTNTAIATGDGDGGEQATATALATVVVGAQAIPPLINIVKVPSRLTPFPYGGGMVTYTYSVTNPGIAPLHNVFVTDDKCPRVLHVGGAGDANQNNLLERGEKWVYTCSMNVPISMKNTAMATGTANGFTTIDYAFANVYVAAPGLPNTGLPPASWMNLLLAAIFGAGLATLAFTLKRRMK